jgi:hypothetical protein
MRIAGYPREKTTFNPDGTYPVEYHDIFFQPGKIANTILIPGGLNQSIPINSRIKAGDRYFKVIRFESEYDDYTGRIVNIRITARQDNGPGTDTTVTAVVVDEREVFEGGVDHDIRPTPKKDLRGGFGRG